MARMTDDELVTLVNKEKTISIAYDSGRLSEMRRRAEYYYLGEAKGELAPPEIEGRSAVVSTDVSDTIEWMLPSLLKIFTAGDNAVEFTPQRQEDEESAKQATNYINYVFYKQNPGFQILYTWFKDALLQKNGILKVWWDDKKDETKEEYKGLNPMQLTMLLQDPEIEPVAQKAYPDPDPLVQQQYQAALQQYQQAAMQAQQTGQPLSPPPEEPIAYDVTVKRTKDCSKVCVEAVPPEEFLISRTAKTIQDASFTAHVTLRTLSDLRAMGYKNVDDLQSDSEGELNGERIERMTWDDEMAPYDYDGADPTQRRIWLTEAYIKVDYDDTGIATWRKVTVAGNRVLDNEECDGPPFVSITPLPLPHRFFGRSIADLAMATQRIKTSIWRATLDNLWLQVNGRYFAVEGQVNLDDLLTTRPGGVVRVKNPNAVGPLQQGLADSGAAYQALEFAENAKENATGFTRYSQGASADTLNNTATGINIITNRSDERVELIARVFAETGVRELFLKILKLVSEYQTTSTVMQVSGQWLQVNPREWATQFDFTVNVGLGTGNKDQVVQHLMALNQVQGQALQLGYATPQNLYNSATKLAENLGFKQPDQFFTDPSQQQPQEPQPDPALIEMQERMALERQKAEWQHQEKMAQLELDREKAIAEDARAREELQLKYIIAPQQEAQINAMLNAQTEREFADGSASGSEPRPAGQGTVEPSPVPGGAIDPQTAVSAGMGGFPGA
jgi:hypothetical protein